MKKEKMVEYTLRRLEIICNKAIRKKDCELALECISSSAYIQYHWNQNYYDDFLENHIIDVVNQIEPRFFKAYENTVLFYDYTGADIRGLTLIYLKALKKMGMNIVHVTRHCAIGKQPVLHRTMGAENFTTVFFDSDGTYLNQINELINIFMDYKPKYAFSHTIPFDVIWGVVFKLFDGVVQRYLINLTDHAFWIGKNSFDKIIEFREYGANISHFYRNIERDKIELLPYYPMIDESISFQGFPDGIEDSDYIFSGGSLYKTFDEYDTYYTMIEYILSRTNVKFLYAGNGDCSHLEKLKNKFPNRVLYISERKDFFYLIRHSILYINTYPMCGGLMMQYAVMASKLPFTLRHNDDCDGILINQDKIGIMYDRSQELANDVIRCIKDRKYLYEKEKKIQGSVIDEEMFNLGLIKIIRNENSGYVINWSMLDSTRFRKEYIYRFKKQVILEGIARHTHKSLIKYFPNLFINRVLSIFLKSIRCLRRG